MTPGELRRFSAQMWSSGASLGNVSLAIARLLSLPTARWRGGRSTR